MALTLTRTTTWLAAEPDTSIARKLRESIELATFANMDYTNFKSAGSIQPFQRQGSAPSSVDKALWVDTAQTQPALRRYGVFQSNGSFFLPVTVGSIMKNATGSTRSAGDVVSQSGGAAAFAFDNDATGDIVGVVGESIVNNAFGIVYHFGLVNVNVTGVINRADFVRRNAASSFSAVGGASDVQSFGLIVAAATVGKAWCLIRAFNKP